MDTNHIMIALEACKDDSVFISSTDIHFVYDLEEALAYFGIRRISASKSLPEGYYLALYDDVPRHKALLTKLLELDKSGKIWFSADLVGVTSEGTPLWIIGLD